MHGIMKAARLCQAFMGRLNIGIAVICGTIVFLYMFLVSTNIAGRYFFNRPIDGTLEIGQLVLATVIFFNLAHAEMKNSHIRVVAVLELLPRKWRDKIETAILAVGFLMMVLMAWRSIPFALESFHMREVHMSVDVPIWPTKSIFFIGWSMLGFQFLIELINRIIPESDTEESPGLQEKG